MDARRPPPSGTCVTVRRGWTDSPRARPRSASAIRLTHSAMGRSRGTSAWAMIRTFIVRSLVEQNRALLVEPHGALLDPLREPLREPALLLRELPTWVGHDVERHVDPERAPRDHVPRDSGREAGAAEGDLEDLLGVKLRKNDERGRVRMAGPGLLDRVAGDGMVGVLPAIEIDDG